MDAPCSLEATAGAPHRSWLAHLPEALVGLVVFVVAAWCASDGVHWLDSGEFTATAIGLGIPHPPGHPLHGLTSQLLLWLPVGSLAARVAWASALALAVGWTALAATLRVLLREHFPALDRRVRGTLVVCAGLGGGLAASSLLQGGRAEVYALHAALLLPALGLLLTPPCTPVRRLAALLLVGLALANHHYLVLLALPGLTLAWFGSRQAGGRLAGFELLEPRRAEWLLAPLALGCGLLTYLYLPLRAASTTPIAWGDPTTPARLYWVVSAEVFQKAMRAAPADVLRNLGEAWLLLMEPLHPAGFAAALVGLLLLARRARLGALALLLLATGTALSQSLMSIDPFNPDLHGYFLVAVATLVLAAGYCGGWLLAALPATLPRLQRPLTVALLVLAAAWPLRSLARADEPLAFARLAAPTAVAREILARLPPHAVAVTDDFSTIFLLWGSAAGEARRPDVELVHRNFLSFPGWIERQSRLAPGLEPLLWQLLAAQRGGGGFGPGGPALRRPLAVEPYHNLEQPLASGLRPDGLLHRWAPDEPFPAQGQPGFWRALDAALGPADRADPQTRRYLFWQHVLQGQQYARLAAVEAALAEYQAALALAPDNPDVLELVGQLPARAPRAR